MVKDTTRVGRCRSASRSPRTCSTAPIGAEEEAVSQEHQARGSMVRQPARHGHAEADGRAGVWCGPASSRRCKVHRRTSSPGCGRRTMGVSGHRKHRSVHQRGRAGDADHGAVATGHLNIRGTPCRTHHIAGQGQSRPRATGGSAGGRSPSRRRPPSTVNWVRKRRHAQG